MGDRDADAFRALYREHYTTVCRYLAARTEREHVEDVAAETFLVAWRRQAELPDHIVPWLLNAAAKCLANHRRARERAAALAGRLAAVAPLRHAGVEHELAQDARRRALLTALAGLGDGDRELLLLRHWDGLAPREIAAVLELGPVVIRARLHRAGRRLEHALAAELERADVLPLTVNA
jgi:RNA polymerase sigma-70 factor, ECF subfamily